MILVTTLPWNEPNITVVSEDPSVLVCDQRLEMVPVLSAYPLFHYLLGNGEYLVEEA